jgi:hypothetical protein
MSISFLLAQNPKAEVARRIGVSTSAVLKMLAGNESE